MSDARSSDNHLHVTLLGFGEAGQAFAAGWREGGVPAQVYAFDIRTQSPSTAQAKWQDYERAAVNGAESLAEAGQGTQMVFSLVTADQAGQAAHAAADLLAPGTVFFDCNSCSPGTKRRNASLLEARGIHYVDTALMAPVHPRRHETPLLVSGPSTDRALGLLSELGMRAETAGPEVGTASATKMVRSVMIKGIEALTLECLLAGRRAGVDAAVLASLDASMPGWNWPVRAAYNMERATMHGLRRAAEMREVAQTVEELGLPPDMSRAIVEWQHRAGELGLDLSAEPESPGVRADRLNAALANRAEAAE